MRERSVQLIWAGLLVAGLAHAASARAAEGDDTSILSFSGFGTFAMVHSSEEHADFAPDIFKPDGAGYTHTWAADVDSRLGAQASLRVTPGLSAMLQVIAEQNYDDNYRPHVEWFNLKYELSPDLSVRVGRIVLPSFLYSDTRKVGYALPWVRPPVDMYTLVPISNSDGLDVSYKFRLGTSLHTVLTSYGRTTTTFPGGEKARARRQWAVTDTIEYGQATFFITYHEAHLTVTRVNGLFEAFRHFGPQGNAIADRYDVNDTPLEFFGIGSNYDTGKWFVMGEWGWTNTHSVLGEKSAWYVSAGYRLGPFTPYMTYGAINSESATSDPGLDAATLPPFLAGPAAGLNAGLNGILGSAAIQQTLSVGLRWDFFKGLALKLQVDHTNMAPGSPGTLTNIQPGFQPGGDLTLLNAGIDFVW